MRTQYATLLVWSIFSLGLTVVGCDQPTSSVPPPKPDSIQRLKRVPKPVPTSIQEVEALGVPILPGTLLDDGDKHTRLDDGSFERVYYAKMYAPSTVANVLTFYMKALEGAKRQASLESERVTGLTKEGDELDVRIGKSADPAKALVMVWLKQPKTPQ